MNHIYLVVVITVCYIFGVPEFQRSIAFGTNLCLLLTIWSELVNAVVLGVNCQNISITINCYTNQSFHAVVSRINLWLTQVLKTLLAT